MAPSSRTPEGRSDRCPLCGNQVCVDPSSFPPYDATCPHCGHLLWLSPTTASRSAARVPELGAAYAYGPIQGAEDKPFGKLERIEWALLSFASSIIIWVNDQHFPATAVWLVGSMIFGQLILPPIFRRLHYYVNRNDCFWLAVVCGWGLVAGLPVGLLFGVLIPCFHDCGVSSFVGGVGGLICGPILAAIEGLTIAGVFNAIMWVATGNSLKRW